MITYIVVTAALMAGSSASAQTAPKSSGDPLQEICTGFLAQSGAGIAGDHTRLCACLVGETQKRLTRDEMIAYDKANSSGQPPPPEVMQKVMGIATTCLTQAR